MNEETFFESEATIRITDTYIQIISKKRFPIPQSKALEHIEFCEKRKSGKPFKAFGIIPRK